MSERQKSDALLGVKSPCHGEYKCTACNRYWHSCLAWRDFGQECKGCTKKIKPSNLQPLYPYCCTNPSCGSQWKDKRQERSECLKCGFAGKMFLILSDRRQYVEAKKLTENTGERPLHNHEKDLCERCQATPGKDCRSAEEPTRQSTTKTNIYSPPDWLLESSSEGYSSNSPARATPQKSGAYGTPPQREVYKSPVKQNEGWNCNVM